MQKLTKHKFRFSLPLYPDNDGVLEIDGKELRHVENLIIKAGTNGFSNVTIEMQAPAVVDLIAVLFLTIKDDETFDKNIVDVFNKAIESRPDVHIDYEDGEREELAKVLKTFLTFLIEENGEPV